MRFDYLQVTTQNRDCWSSKPFSLPALLPTKRLSMKRNNNPNNNNKPKPSSNLYIPTIKPNHPTPIFGFPPPPFSDDQTNPFLPSSQSPMNPYKLPFKEEDFQLPGDDEPAFEVVEEELNDLIKSEGEETEGALLKLPLDIFLDIISRLPIKPLGVGRCVCKTWRSVIHHSRFINMHHTKAMQQQQPHVLNASTSLLLHFSVSLLTKYKQFDSCSELHFVEHDDDDSFGNGVVVTPQLMPSNIDFKLSDLRFQVIGSCNGLVCLGDPFKWDPVYVCNPIVGDYVMLPRNEKDSDFGIVSGFGFDRVGNEYKVVRMVFSDDLNGKSKMESEVYTLGSGEWRKLGDVPHPFWKRFSSVFVSGTLHWMTGEYGDRIIDKFILAFDVGREDFRFVPPPPNFTPFCKDECKLELGDLGGNLCLCDYSPKQCDIWLLKDHGVDGLWTKQYVIPRILEDLGFRCEEVDFRPVTLTKSGNILLVVNDEALVRYDPVRKSFNKLEICRIPSRFEAITHVGSFISLKDIVGATNCKHSSNNKRWYSALRLISSQTNMEELMLNELQRLIKHVERVEGDDTSLFLNLLSLLD